jgi:hypothetical protein
MHPLRNRRQKKEISRRTVIKAPGKRRNVVDFSPPIELPYTVFLAPLLSRASRFFCHSRLLCASHLFIKLFTLAESVVFSVTSAHQKKKKSDRESKRRAENVDGSGLLFFLPFNLPSPFFYHVVHYSCS